MTTQLHDPLARLSLPATAWPADRRVTRPADPARSISAARAETAAPRSQRRSRCRATAALEFALASPLLLVMLGGAADFGLAEYYRANLANAVAAGAQYAYYTGTGVTTSNIQSVVQNAMYLPAGASGNLSFSFTGASPGITTPGWYCITGTTPTVATSSQGATCSDGAPAGYYLWFQASYTDTGLLSGVLTTANRTMSEQVTVRLQ